MINNKIINFTSPYNVLRGLWGDEDTDSVTNKEFQHFIPDVWLSPIRELTLPHVEEDGLSHSFQSVSCIASDLIYFMMGTSALGLVRPSYGDMVEQVAHSARLQPAVG